LFYYNIKDKVLVSRIEYSELNCICEEKAINHEGLVYMLNSIEPSKSRRCFSVSHPSLAFIDTEGIELLQKKTNYTYELPEWLISKIDSREVMSVNTSYHNWQEVLDYTPPKNYTVNVVGLGDVGGILTTGLRLMAGEHISRIGLYDIDENKVNRWVQETGQILPPFSSINHPDVYSLTEDRLFDCDMFVFCVSVGVPPLNNNTKDVRMAQFEGNSHIIKKYAKMARQKHFKGIFAVVSDPVDLLCKVVLNESNTGENNILDFKGLSPEQIRGYGLGVMNGRASYYAIQNVDTLHFLSEGRVFGPHGEGLIVADSIENYNQELSLYLTEKTQNANMEIRSTGFKPYIAPALSSGSLAIIATISGAWHYSATFMGGVFMGSKNRLNKSGVEIETLDIPELLWNRLKNTYEVLGNIL